MFKNHKSACLTEWNKIMSDDQDKRQTNSTPDSSSGVISDFVGITISENVDNKKLNKPNNNWIFKNSQFKKTAKKSNAPFSPEKTFESSVYQNFNEMNTFLEPIDERFSHANQPSEKTKTGKLKKQVKLFFSQSHSSTKSQSHSSSTASATNETLKENLSFSSFSDSVITHIFSFLLSNQLCKCAMVCKRWYQLVWNPRLWSHIEIHSYKLEIDKAIKSITRALSIDELKVCLIVQSIDLSHCRSLTDKGLFTLARRCIELKELTLDSCIQVTNISIFEIVSRCTNLELLSVAACPYVTCISLTPEANLRATTYGKQIFLSHLDMSDCSNVDDSSLHIIATYLSNLMNLFLRRCFKVGDIGIQYVSTYCTKLQELSVSDCPNISDFGLRDISRLGSSLKYLSIAKCKKITDAGLKCFAGNCTKIRYLNMRGLENVTEDGLSFLFTKCHKLKSLDVGNCVNAVTDASLAALARNCSHLRRLSIKECTEVSDEGIKYLAMTLSHLQQVNLIDCHLTSSSFKALSHHCNDCIIEFNDYRFCN